MQLVPCCVRASAAVSAFVLGTRSVRRFGTRYVCRLGTYAPALADFGLRLVLRGMILCGAVCVLYEGVQGVVYVFQIVDFVAHITLFGKTYRACFAYDRNFDLPGISELVLYAACYFG